MKREILNLDRNPRLKELLVMYCKRSVEQDYYEPSDELLMDTYYELLDKGELNKLFIIEMLETPYKF